MEQTTQATSGAQATGNFDTDTFLVREHVGFLKLHEAYDILSTSGAVIGTAVERASAFIKICKLLVNKNMLPFTVEIMNADQKVLLTISRPFTIFRSVVSVCDTSGKRIGYFRQRLLSLGGRFDLFADNDVQIASLKGDWKGWNFRFLDAKEQEIGSVSRQWGGLAKELFTNADNYVVRIDRAKISDTRHVQLLLAAAMCIDMVLKESEG